MPATDDRAQLIGVELRERTDAQIALALEDKDLGDDYDLVFDALKRLRDYAAAEGLGVKLLAHRVPRMTSGVLSELYTGNYPGNYGQRCRVILKFLTDLEKRAIYGGIDTFVPTEIAKGMWHLFDRTRYSRRIQIVQSAEQCGKSCAAREYTHRNNGGRTVMVTLKEAGASNPFGVFLRDLALAAGYESISNHKIMDLRFGTLQKLAICDLVIIDELHQIRNWPERAVLSLLEFMRIELHADGQRGIVLIATNDDAMRLLDAFRKRTRYNLGQLLGRMCAEVREIAPEDIPMADVRALVERYYKPGRATLDQLYALATRPRMGHLGLILDIMKRCWAEAKLAKTEIVDAMVKAKMEVTLAELQSRKELYA